jgi:riboflavin biosynthesis pyrimidine reductase
MYEVMAVWDDPATFAAGPACIRELGELWRAAEKIVYSTTLVDVHAGKTRVERSFDPDAVRRLKAAAARDLSIGGPDLAGQALRAGLVDELGLFAAPVLVGGGTPWLPTGVRLRLNLLEERRFTAGIVCLRYGVRGPLDRPPRGE